MKIMLNLLQLLLLSFMSFYQFQNAALLQQQNALLQSELKDQFKQGILLNAKIDHLNSIIVAQTTTQASSNFYLEYVVLGGVLTIIFILLFKPESSESTVTFFQDNFKQISRENSTILGRLDDISRLTIDKAESSVLGQLPDAKTVESVSDVMKNLFNY